MRYFIGFLVTIGLIILLIVILVGGGGDKKAAVPTAGKTLYSYANTDAEVKMTVDGPINYDGSHRQSQVIVNQQTVVYNQINGYDGKIAMGQSYPNTEAAYDNFLHALARYGFTKGNTDKSMADEKGYCAEGNRYVFELTQGGKTLERFWTTSCGGKMSTYQGVTGTTLDLFKAQVPSYSTISGDYNNF